MDSKAFFSKCIKNNCAIITRLGGLLIATLSLCRGIFVNNVNVLQDVDGVFGVPYEIFGVLYLWLFRWLGSSHVKELVV